MVIYLKLFACIALALYGIILLARCFDDADEVWTTLVRIGFAAAAIAGAVRVML